MNHNDKYAVIQGVRAMLVLAGVDPNAQDVRDTPERFLAAWLELTSAPSDPADILSRTFEMDIDQMVCVGPIEFASMCEHHLLPFTGVAWLAYIPDGKVVGLSKLPRLVEHYARRPQVQERLTGQLTQALDKFVTSNGSAALVRASHTCSILRGIRREAPMTTTSLSGGFLNPETRQEFLSYVFG